MIVAFGKLAWSFFITRIVIAEDEIASLKRFKDDAKEVAEGYECGVTLEKFADVKEGDVYEAFKMEEYRD